jgi:hypothetical protein
LPAWSHTTAEHSSGEYMPQEKTSPTGLGVTHTGEPPWLLPAPAPPLPSASMTAVPPQEAIHIAKPAATTHPIPPIRTVMFWK